MEINESLYEVYCSIREIVPADIANILACIHIINRLTWLKLKYSKLRAKITVITHKPLIARQLYRSFQQNLSGHELAGIKPSTQSLHPECPFQQMQKTCTNFCYA